MSRVQLYGFHDRMWHWVQACVVLGLLLTGAALRYPGALPGLGFRVVLHAHLGLGVLLVINAVAGVLYFLFSGAIRHYLPQPRDYWTLAWLQVRYYVRGIFQGAEHPFHKSTRGRLNPLQQLTYLGLLNALLPLQIVTGVVLWVGAGQLDLAPLHALGAWLFASFLVTHLYLTTTGETPLANLRAMLTGFEELPDATPTAPEEAP